MVLRFNDNQNREIKYCASLGGNSELNYRRVNYDVSYWTKWLGSQSLFNKTQINLRSQVKSSQLIADGELDLFYGYLATIFFIKSYPTYTKLTTMFAIRPIDKFIYLELTSSLIVDRTISPIKLMNTVQFITAVIEQLYLTRYNGKFTVHRIDLFVNPQSNYFNDSFDEHSVHQSLTSLSNIKWTISHIRWMNTTLVHQWTFTMI